jgi:heavy metal sensor kinase
VAVLGLSFIAFFWICDLGFRQSIEATVNNASQTNLETVKRLLEKSTDNTPAKIANELRELSTLWANGALLEVADSRGNWLFRSPQFDLTQPPLPVPPGSRLSFFTTNLEHFQYRVAMQRVPAGESTFEIHTAVPTEPFDQALDNFRLIEKECLPLLVLLASLLGYWLSYRSLAPVNRIIQTADQIGVENLSKRLEVPKAQDELRRLSMTLNAMLARIEKSFQKITQFTADASHDLRTPVAVIRTSAELALRKERSAAEYRDALTKILSTSVETSELLENLLSLARADAGALGLELHPLELGAHVRKIQEQALILSSEKDLDFRMETPLAPVWVKADAIALNRLLMILVDNAIKYTPNGGHCEISLSQDKTSAQITVTDSGIGITKEDLLHVFDRFYRADRARTRNRRGAGLGLAIARWITDMHGGNIAVQSEPGMGSVFTISLPIAQSS